MGKMRHNREPSGVLTKNVFEFSHSHRSLRSCCRRYQRTSRSLYPQIAQRGSTKNGTRGRCGRSRAKIFENASSSSQPILDSLADREQTINTAEGNVVQHRQ